MNKRTFAFLFASVLLSSGLSAAEFNFDQKTNAGAVLSSGRYISSVPTARQGRSYGRRRGANGTWTVMIFANGKNSLEDDIHKDVNEMERAGSTDRVKVVAEFGGMNTGGVRRYFIQKDADMNTINSPVVKEVGNADMGDYRQLVDFAKWAKATYPADNYMLVIENHGSGWNRRMPTILSRGISYDDATGNHITTPQLGMALKEMGGVNVYGSDACLMQMAEVDYEIAPYVQYIVGSEETEPGAGWDYTSFITKLQNEPELNARNVAIHAVNAYGDQYMALRQSSTMSAIDTAALPDFAKLLDAWTDAVVAANESAVVKSARSQAQSYAVRDNKSLAHFVYLVGKATANADVKAKGNALIDFLQKALVIDNRTVGYDNSRGLAVYLPNYRFSPDYAALQFSKISKWGQFAKWASTL